MQNNLEKLRIALDNRNTTRGRLAELQAGSEADEDPKVSELDEKLARRETSLEQARALVRHELADVKKARDEAEKRLEKARGSRTVGFETAEEHRLNATIQQGDMLTSHLEQALVAEDPQTVKDILASVQKEASTIPSPFSMESSRFGDWPGPSVPERLMMLFKEARSPGSKKPILISGGIMAILALVILGSVTISMLRSDQTNANPIGVGEAVVPILIDSADEATAIEVTIEYDETVLTAREVRKGLMGTLGKIASDVSMPGTVTFAVTDKAGIVGSGDLVLILFKADHIAPDPVDIVIVSASAVNKNGEEASLRVEHGWLETGALVNYAPTIHFE